MRKVLLAALAPVLLIGAMAIAEDFYVTKTGQELLPDTAYDPTLREIDPLADPVGLLNYNERVSKVSGGPADAYWLVRRPNGQQGYMLAKSLSPQPGTSTAASAGNVGVSNDDVAAASRGFTPELENQRRQQDPNLPQFYNYVDSMEQMAGGYEAAMLRQFRNEGNLGRKGGQ